MMGPRAETRHETQESTSGIKFSRPVKIQVNGLVSGPGR
jgi:hypothetical protein